MDISNKTIHYSGINALRLEWPAELCIKYGVVLTFNSAEGKSNEVKYVLQITRLKPGPAGQALFQIERIGDVFVNEILPDLVADRLAYAAGQVFYPLVIAVDQNGGFESIYNHQEILKRWPGIKDNILNNFEGSVVEDYIGRMEQQLANADCIQLAFLNNDWFIQTFFKPIYKEYGPDQVAESTYKFPIARDFKTEGYLTREKLSAETNDFGGIELLHEGPILAMEEEELYLDSQITGDYKGVYLLHPKFKRIISVVSDFTYQELQKKSVQVKIVLIPEEGNDFDHDFILDTNVTGLPVSEMVILDGQSGKGFWDRLLK